LATPPFSHLSNSPQTRTTKLNQHKLPQTYIPPQTETQTETAFEPSPKTVLLWDRKVEGGFPGSSLYPSHPKSDVFKGYRELTTTTPQHRNQSPQATRQRPHPNGQEARPFGHACCRRKTSVADTAGAAGDGSDQRRVQNRGLLNRGARMGSITLRS